MTQPISPLPVIPLPPTRAGATGKMHMAVVRRLGARILGGDFQPGDALPGEGDLARHLDVSRTTIREAVKVLAAKGLVEIRTRTGIKIRPREEWRVLDPDVLSWHPDLCADQLFIDSLVESRRIIEPAAAELAAQRATAEDLFAIENAYHEMCRSAPDDMVSCNEADIRFHRAVIHASRNIVLKGLTSTIEAALRAAFLATSELMDQDVLDAHHRIVESIRLRRADAAREAMIHLLEIAAEDLHGDLRR